MIFMVAFIVLCVLTIKDVRAIRKLKQKVAALEVSLLLKDDVVTQSPRSDPAQLEHDCVTNEHVKG